MKTRDSVSQFKAQLRKLSQYWEYGNSLDFMLRDHLVCGTNHDQTHQTLLIEEGILSLRKPMDISIFLESAIKKPWKLNRKLI